MTESTSRQVPRHFLLHPEDTATQTFGCRGVAPGFCNHLDHPTCAFARADGLCLTPPPAWKDQYESLSAATTPDDAG